MFCRARGYWVIACRGNTDPLKNFPYDYWIPQLEKFMAGGGCPLPEGVTVSCPAAGAGFPKDAWKPGGDPVSYFFCFFVLSFFLSLAIHPLLVHCPFQS